MNISSFQQTSLHSVRQALGIATMQKAMSQDAASVAKLVEGMKSATQNLQRATQPHLGGNIDIRI